MLNNENNSTDIISQMFFKVRLCEDYKFIKVSPVYPGSVGLGSRSSTGT